MKKSLLLLIVCWLSLTPLWGQYISIEDIHFPAGTAFQQLRDNRMVMSYSLKPSGDQNKLRTFLFDTLLQVHNSFQTTLPFDFRVLKVAKAGDYYAHLLQSRGKAKEAVLVITDHQGNISGQYQLEGKWKGFSNVHQKATQLYGALHEPAFYLIFKKEKKLYNLLKLMHDGSLAWEHSSPMETFTAPKLVARDEHLYIFEREIGGLRTHKEQVVVLNAFDGQIKAQFSPGQPHETIRSNRVSVSASGDTISFLGRSYAGGKLDNHSAGMLYLAQYNAEGNLLEEQRLANDTKRIYWHELVNSKGRQYLVGETFRTTSFGEHMLVGMATGLLTLGTLYISKATLTTKDLVIRPLDGTAAEQKIIALAPSRFTIANHNSPFVFADSYVGAGAFRYRHAQNGEVLLQVNDDAYRLPLADDAPAALQPAGKLAPLEHVLYYGDGYFIAFTTEKSKNVYRLQRYALKE